MDTKTAENPTSFVTPKDLASKLGVEEKRVRIMLRAALPRDTKNARWQITPQQAKQIVKDYKAKQKAKEDKKKEKISQELEGKA